MVFWRLQGGMLQKSRIYMVPAADSVRGNWGSGARAKAVKSVFDNVGKAIKMLPTVKEMMAELDLTEEKVFVWDWLHMTRDATRKIHDLLEIHRSRHRNKESSG